VAILKKLTLRHIATPKDVWTVIAPGISLLVKQEKTVREFESKIISFSELEEYSGLLEKRLGVTPNKYSAPGVYFCEIEDGFISPRLSRLPRYWVVGNDKYYIDDFLNSTWKDHIPDGMVFKETGDPVTADISFVRTVHVNQPVIFLNFFSNTNHLLHESLPALLHIKEFVGDNPDYLVYSGPVKPFIKRFLYDIGFPVHKMIELHDSAITAPKIFVSCFAGGGHLNNPSIALDQTCDMLSNTLPKMYRPGETPERIFVSRSDATQRMLLNEKSITDFLTKNHGFRVVVPGNMSVAQQIEYFSNASIVVGPHGMGINNFAFAKSPKLLVELFQPNWVREAYCRQAQIKGATYAAYIGQALNGDLSIDSVQFIDFFEKCVSEVGI
jgi:hypothetical protein